MEVYLESLNQGNKSSEPTADKPPTEANAAVERTRREIEVKVDGQVKRVPPGTYIVSVFKELVGVAADRELDVVDHDVFKPLDDNAEIKIHEGEVFVSHVRTGGSA
jgi:hypothetical protein